MLQGWSCAVERRLRRRFWERIFWPGRIIFFLCFVEGWVVSGEDGEAGGAGGVVREGLGW